MWRTVITSFTALVLVASAARAQEGRVTCDKQAGLYRSSNGLELLVFRTGSLAQNNPLRPLSKEPIVVLQIGVNGHSGFAYGTDFVRYMETPSQRDLEDANASPVRWAQSVAALPTRIYVTPVYRSSAVGPFEFQACSDRAKPPLVAGARKRPAPTASARRSEPAVPSGFRMPAGAIDE